MMNVPILWVKVAIQALPPEFVGFKIVQLTDVHRGMLVSHQMVVQGVELARGLEPDLVALTGDYVTGTARRAYEVARVVRSRLTPPHGIFAVLGNHDYWTNAEAVGGAFAGQGIPVLINEHRKIARGDAAIYLLGVDDVWSGRPALDRAVEGVPPGAVKILLCHEPDYADTAKDFGIALQMSGHSHGGQVRIPLIPPIYPPLGRKYPVGLQRVKDSEMQVYTSRGLGHVFPGRFHCPPEITLITLALAKPGT